MFCVLIPLDARHGRKGGETLSIIIFIQRESADDDSATLTVGEKRESEEGHECGGEGGGI